MRLTRNQRAFDTFEQATQVPMLVLALAIIPVFLIPQVTTPGAQLEKLLNGLEWFIWAAFAVELSVKTYLAPHRLHYLKTHWYDVVIVVLPLLRPLRLLRSTRLLRLLRLVRPVVFLVRAGHSIGLVLNAHGLKYVVLLTMAVIFAAAGIVTVFESDGGTITDFDDGLWWALTTVTTVGYGDKYPITAEGRAVAVVLMVLGITTFSILTANIAAFLVKPEDKSEASLDDVMEELRALRREVEELKREEASIR